MELVNGYWIDENNNKWSEYFYTEKQAKMNSESLINCHDCHDCLYCHDCRNCRNCHDCHDCRNCRNCHDCRNCHNCHDCHDYIENPLIYSTKKIGSRYDNTIFYYGMTKNNEMSLQVVCGCFRGNFKEFESAVMKTHKNNSLYRNEYLKEIEKVKVLFEV